MRKFAQFGVIIGLLASSLGGMAMADDMVSIKISNDDTDDILVTVYDMNAEPPGAVVIRQRISGFAWIPLAVTAGKAGFGHIRWTATSAVAGLHRCGRQDTRGLERDDSVPVFADSPCGGQAMPPGTP